MILQEHPWKHIRLWQSFGGKEDQGSDVRKQTAKWCQRLEDHCPFLFTVPIPCLTVSQRVQVVQKGTSQAQRVGQIPAMTWWIQPVPSNYIGTYPWYCTCIVYKLYIYTYVYILANIFQYSVVPILSLHLRIQPGFNIAGCGRQIEGHPVMSRCCMMSYAYCIYIWYYNII